MSPEVTSNPSVPFTECFTYIVTKQLMGFHLLGSPLQQALKQGDKGNLNDPIQTAHISGIHLKNPRFHELKHS